jgi:tetratricopeptide (TPR) repeat protein
MISNIRKLFFPALLLALSGAAQAIPLLEGLGGHSMAITTREAQAQRYFDQGLKLAWGFHFGAAERSFRRAAELDPQCAMCRWGIALSLGPSINHDPTPSQVEAARAASAEAMALAAATTARERSLIEAQARRHPPGRETVDDDAYALAMRAVARRHPRDADVLTLAADALMAPHGRDYWRKDGRPQKWTRIILDTLDAALRLAPGHPGAHHLRIHVLEDSPHPQRALESAERLPALAPGLGHLVHMPTHVYFHMGRYADALAANERAIEADRDLAKALGDDPAYATGYALHNHHFLWTAAIMAGRAGKARAAAALLARHAESAPALRPPSGTLQQFASLPLLTQVRFGEWEGILREPKPRLATPYTTGIHHFARAMAFARTGRAAEAAREIGELTIAHDLAARDAATLKNANALGSLLAIARRIAEAEAAAAAGDSTRAVEGARAAVALEAALEADEPPAWPLPARHFLGALLLEQGRAVDAQRVYEQDLRIHPANGWALAGLAASLRRAGRERQAADAGRRFERAWSGAEVPITGSRF